MLLEHEVVLLHVELAHVLGQAGRGRLHARELVGRLRAVAERQLGLGVEFAGLLHHLQQVRDRDLAQHVAGPLGVAHVALDQPAVGPADLGQHLAGGEVDDLVGLEALVRLAPAQDGDVDHGESPSECGCGISIANADRNRRSLQFRNLRRLATRAQGRRRQSDWPFQFERRSIHPDRRRRRDLVERPHAADAVPRVLRRTAASRSPSSRSAKRGTKNSFVSVVSSTRPVWPTGDQLVVVLEVDDLGDGPRLRGVVGDLVVVSRPSASRPRPGPSACCRRSA